MSYVPPHKRHSNRNPTPTPVPSSVKPKPFASPRHGRHQNSPFPTKIAYSSRLISRWYATSSESLALVPYDAEALERKNGSKPLTLTVTDEASLVGEEERRVLRGIHEKVARDLIEASQHAREETGCGDVKLLVMARVGKVLFFGFVSSISFSFSCFVLCPVPEARNEQVSIVNFLSHTPKQI
jgi:hypothetical protein